MSTAEAGDAREPPGLGPPRTRRSAATRAMAAAAGAGEEEAGPLLYVLALPVEIPLPVAVARIDAGVPRKARTGRSRPRAKPAGWWAFRLVNFPPVKAAAAKKSSPEKERSPHRERLVSVCLGLGTPDLEEERPAKKARRCVQCGSAETPQWRSGPMGRSTLCNACGVRLRAAGALRETAAEQRPPPPATKPRKVNNPPPPSPESPGSDSDSPICARRAPPGDVYLVRKQPKRERRTPRKDSSPAAASRAIYLVKKKKPSKKPWRPRNTGQRCLHCGTTSTPQWREGPMGRHTLCNACGVRYRQGRLLPEYRPAASPTFVPSEHASRHREVVQLHRQRQGDGKAQQRRKQQHSKLLPVDDDDGILLPERRVDAAGSDEDDKNNVFLVRRERPVEKLRYPPTPPHRPLPQPVEDEDDPRGGNNGTVAGCGGRGGDQKDMPGALDSLLLDGPSAPLIVDGGDGDEFMVS